MTENENRFLVTTPEEVYKRVDEFKKTAKLLYINSVVPHMRNLKENDKLFEYWRANFSLDLDKEHDWIKRLTPDQQAMIGFERWLEREMDHRTEAFFFCLTTDMYVTMARHEKDMQSPWYPIKQWWAGVRRTVKERRKK